MRALVPALLLVAAPALAQPVPAPLAEVAVEERLGEPLPLAARFTDHEGRDLALGDLLDGKRPLVLVLAYYGCPALCDLLLRGTVDVLRDLGWEPGDRFHIVTVSFDARDRPADALRKRKTALAALGRAATEPWPFLVGEEAEIRRLTGALGFRFGRDARTGDLAHAAALFFVTPDGRVARALHGVRFRPPDVKLAILEAGVGRVGSLAEQVLLSCYRYDPSTRRYGLHVFGFLRLGGVAILLVVGGVLCALWRSERRRRR